MKKAIVAVPYLSGKGGTETVIKNFQEAMSQYGDENYSWKLVSYGGTKYSRWMKEWKKKVYSFSNNRYIQILAYIFLLPILIPKTLKKEKPDFFIATNPVIWTIAYRIRKFVSPKTKIISWYHYSFKRKNIKKKYLKTADLFWAISSGIEDELISLDVPKNKIKVIYNPVNIENAPLVKRSGIQNHFIYIGRIDYDGQKNVSELIHALNNVDGNWHCDLYGAINEGLKKKLLNIASKNTKKNITFKGFNKDVWDQINEADALILTSKYEGLPMVLIEAAAHGIFLISSNCPMGPKDIVTANNGLLYNSGDIKAIGITIRSIVSKNIKIPKSLEIKNSVKKFSYKKYVRRIENFMEENKSVKITTTS